MQPTTHAELVHQASAWAEDFAQCVRNRDFESALTLFSPMVLSYGTKVVEVSSLEQLRKEQWRPTWLRTQYFAYLPDSIATQVSIDGSMAIVCARWTSEGVDTPDSWAQQQPYRRSGRCTFVLISGVNGSWICTHTHFSLDPDVSPN